MNRLVDLLFAQPLPHSLHQALLFATFLLHFVLVLTMIGTAVIAFYYFVQRWWGGRMDETKWDRRVLKAFLPLEALAVVLGVGPLLLVQVGHTVSFFAAANILAPYWVLLITLMIVAFLALDILEHHSTHRSYLNLALGIIGLTALLAIPGVFVAIFALSENPQQWAAVIQARHSLVASLGWFWLFRYLHVLGAAIIFGAVFHYLFSNDADRQRKTELMYWVMGAVLFQVAAGLAIFLKLPTRLDGLTIAFLLIGICAAVVLLMVAFYSVLPRIEPLRAPVIAIAAVAVLLPMLLTRQAIQDRAFFPIDRAALQNANLYAAQLAPYHQASIAGYQQHMAAPVEGGQAIYEKSCMFCHGELGDGEGRAAQDLNIAPAPLAQIRTTRAYVRDTLLTGVHGSAMPTFRFYTPRQLDSLITHLNDRFNIIGVADPAPFTSTAQTMEHAAEVWSTTCATCHGSDGAGSPRGRAFQPPVPDFTQYSVTPERGVVAITAGYSGTMMYPYGDKIPDEVKWALVDHIRAKRKQ